MEVTYFADARQHIDRRPEMPNMKHRQRQLDVPIMSHTPRCFLTARQTRLALFARAQPAVQRTVLCRRLGTVLVDLVQLLDGHFGLGYADNVFWFEGLELDVFTVDLAG
jgi:hypothetical protein